jgi:hypothetical protein
MLVGRGPMRMEDRERRAQNRGQRMVPVKGSPSSVLQCLALIALALVATGCRRNLFSSPPWLAPASNSASQGLQVVPRSCGQIVNLAADDIVGVMRRMGFRDDQILDLGPRLRDALRTAGGAAFVRGRQIDAMIAVSDGYLFVQSNLQGSFIYDIKDKIFAAVPRMPAP